MKKSNKYTLTQHLIISLSTPKIKDRFTIDIFLNVLLNEKSQDLGVNLFIEKLYIFLNSSAFLFIQAKILLFMIDDNFWQFTRELADETCDALKSIVEVNKIQLVISLTYKSRGSGGRLLTHFSKTIELIISFHGGWCQLSLSVSKRDKCQIW